MILFRTPDEDFSILLEAALMYDRRVAALLGEDDSITNEVVWDRIHNGNQFLYPRLLFIITGMLIFIPCQIFSTNHFSIFMYSKTIEY